MAGQILEIPENKAPRIGPDFRNVWQVWPPVLGLYVAKACTLLRPWGNYKLVTVDKETGPCYLYQHVGVSSANNSPNNQSIIRVVIITLHYPPRMPMTA